MFSGRETARIETERTGSQLEEWLEEGLSALGDVRVNDRGRIDIRPNSRLRDSWSQTSIGGRVRERRTGEVEVELTYTIDVSPMSWVVGILFIPIGIFIFFSVSQRQTRLNQELRDILADLEEEAE